MTVESPELPRAPARAAGWLGALTSTDHKRVGLHLGSLSLVFFVTGGVFALFMRAQLATPNSHVVSDNTYSELFTMHGSTMVYLFVTPMAVAMATYLVPLQVGASSIALPRLSLAGFWVWLSGGLIMQSGWFTSGGPGRDGWFSYIPLSSTPYTPGPGQSLWVVGVLLAVTGTC
jgi:cytochrome c oxidase subunit 1